MHEARYTGQHEVIAPQVSVMRAHHHPKRSRTQDLGQRWPAIDVRSSAGLAADDVVAFGRRDARMLGRAVAHHMEPNHGKHHADAAVAVERPLPAGRFDAETAQRPGEHGAQVYARHSVEKTAFLAGRRPFGDEIL